MQRFKIQYLLILVFPLIASWIGSILAGMNSGASGLSFSQLSLGIAFVTGTLAISLKYLTWPWHYLLAIVISALLALLSLQAIRAPISIFPLFLLNLTYALLTLLALRYVFYIKFLFRIRTILFGVVGAILFSIYLAALYTLLTIELPSGFWNASFLYGLILYVFIGFAMSLADLVILQMEIKKLKHEDSSSDDSGQ